MTLGPRSVRNDEIRPSLVKPWLATVLSLIVPGLGQVLAGDWRRGLVLFLSFISSLGLLAWRMNEAARREEELGAIFVKAIRLQPLLAVLLVMVIGLWLWIAWDAGRTAQGKRTGRNWIFALILLIFFFLGWQITEIDLYKAVTQIDEAGPPLLKILWPWEKAVTREETYISARAQIDSPCTENPPPPPVRVAGEPYILVEPTCGDLSRTGQPGSTLHVIGDGFEPNMQTVFWWEDPLGGEFRIWRAGEYFQVVTDANGEFDTELIMPIVVIPSSAGPGPHSNYLEARQTLAVGPPKPSEELMLAIEKMVETIFLGMMATLFGVVLA
ncbi:MAG: hypothetical protein GWN58_26825, partial [Anaerolineae bacterium]|nr:hypothetical protein [Anaerolineae bacterium]